MIAVVMCEAVTDATPYQRSELARLEELARRVAAHVLTTFPSEPAWRSLRKNWNGSVMLGPTPNHASYDRHSGCLLVGIPPYASDPAVLNARMLLAMSTGVAGGARCTGLHSALLTEASAALGIPVALDCSDSLTHGLNSRSACPACDWRDSSPAQCHQVRHIWPEYVGKYVKDVAAKFPGKKVGLLTFDSLNVKPAASGVVRVTFDAPSGIVTMPPPHLGTLNTPELEGNCFVKPDQESGVGCIGAPVSSPPEWERFVGSLITDAVDSLRVRYPHATIEYIPDTAAVGPELRPDRITVRFDANSGKVSSVPVVG